MSARRGRPDRNWASTWGARRARRRHTAAGHRRDQRARDSEFDRRARSNVLDPPPANPTRWQNSEPASTNAVVMTEESCGARALYRILDVLGNRRSALRCAVMEARISVSEIRTEARL